MDCGLDSREVPLGRGLGEGGREEVDPRGGAGRVGTTLRRVLVDESAEGRCGSVQGEVVEAKEGL